VSRLDFGSLFTKYLHINVQNRDWLMAWKFIQLIAVNLEESENVNDFNEFINLPLDFIIAHIHSTIKLFLP
jgi:hypothetical protein